MHDPLLLTDEHCAELATVTNTCLDKFFTMLGITTYAYTAFNTVSVRELIARDGIYSDWPI